MSLMKNVYFTMIYLLTVDVVDCQRGFQPMLGVISKITKNMDKLSKCKRRCVNSVSCHFFKWKVIKVKY